MDNTTNTVALNDIVSKLRDTARTIIRLRKVNSLRAKIYNAKLERESIEKAWNATVKDMEIATYEAAKLDSADPAYEDKKKMWEKRLEGNTEDVNIGKFSYDKDCYVNDKIIAELEGKIAKWESGENKVDIDEVNELTNKLISEYRG